MTTAYADDPIPLHERNRTLFILGCSLRGRGFEQSGIFTTLRNVNDARCIPPLPLAEVRSIAKSCAKYEIGKQRKVRPQEQAAADYAEIIELTLIAANYPWKRRLAQAATQRAAMLALIGIGGASHRTTVQASDRQWAEAAGISRKAIAAVRPDLQAQGWVKVIERGKTPKETHLPTTATTYRLCRPIRQKDANNTSGEEPEVLLVSSCRSLNSDAWRNRTGLGKSAHRVYQGLKAKPQRICDLARRLDMVRRTVERGLEKLESAGLALKTPAGWVWLDTDVEAVAKTLTSAGTLERQRKQHQADRENYQRERYVIAAKVATVAAKRKRQPIAAPKCAVTDSVDAWRQPPRRANDYEAFTQSRKMLLRQQAAELMAQQAC